MKYSDASVIPLRNVNAKSRVLSHSPQITNAASGRPITSAQKIFQLLLFTRTLAFFLSSDVAAALRADLRHLAELAVLHDREQAVLVLQDREVGERVAVDQQEVGEPAFADLAQVLPHHHLAAPAGGRDDRLQRRHAEVLHEVIEVLGV